MFCIQLIAKLNKWQTIQTIQTALPSICAVKRHSFHNSMVRLDLMEFFDEKKNWGESVVRSGRAWRLDELRIKSNVDLHKLWFVLYKERNMLLTMEEAAKDETQLFASPERLDKVEESMKNLETVVRERNKAYYELEVGEGETGERPRVFRRDAFGRYRWIGCSEHLIPYRLNKMYRFYNGPGFGKDVLQFTRKLREKQIVERKTLFFKQSFYCRQLLKRFPNLDTDYLQEKFPGVDVKHLKENLDEICAKDRWKPFSRYLFKSD